MRMARLELARREPHAPQACVSTNSTTSADIVNASQKEGEDTSAFNNKA